MTFPKVGRNCHVPPFLPNCPSWRGGILWGSLIGLMFVQQSDVPTILRAAERWDQDWKAEVDGAPVEVQRIDYLCQGIALPTGAHDVTLAYSPAMRFFYLQLAGYLILLTTSVSLFVEKNSPAHNGVKNGATAI